MKNIFLKVTVFWCIAPYLFASETEITWTGFGGATSMTGQVAGDQAGYSVAISSDGTIIAVGEPSWSGVDNGSGRVRTYSLQNGTWTEFGGATSMTGIAANNQAGRSVAINFDGSIVAVGEPFWNGVSFSGRVRTYSLQGEVWTQFGGETSMTGQNNFDQAGLSVAISSDGSIVAVGEPAWDGVGGSLNNSGRVRTYKLQNDTWTQFGGETSMTGVAVNDQAGLSVAISSDGSIVAVGEPTWDGVGGSLNNSGRVRTYKLQNDTWTQFGGETSMTGAATTNQAGFSVAISSDGSLVTVGEPFWVGVGSSSGRVRTYRLQNGAWIEFGGETSMTGAAASDQAGNSVAINSDGSIVTVGERGWSGTRGRIRTYSLENGSWIEFGGATSMTGAATGDNAGYSVAISSNGSIVAAGERGWSGSRGRVRTYFYPSSNDNENEFIIRNSELAHVCYSDISQGTVPGHQTTPGGVGQGAWFTPYHIMVQGK